ncbi:MAG: cytochrome b/b6 domain-containing protein [Azonexus sp.]|jgi:cytochrome b|uniref:cytochrome b/b6 domain-containing protein n=1 Tax=Azonexus sp. TaxID=1872668 RepID=UPI002839C5C7|nr:cytochrome b/b6 domain-containing protein [Azonexus sp.]MDR0776956.1 cytochrome b/b6 domain-containing protein [Azonexus sp.]
MNTSEQQGLVWDLPVRIGHWLLVACFATAWLTGESEERRLIHVYAGGLMLGVVSFRLLWGFIGSPHALFGDFVRGPRTVIDYLQSLFSKQPRHFIGHNPAGGWAVMALLTLVLLGSVSGWLNYQELGGEWAEELHEATANMLLAVVAAHLCGVLVSCAVHRENLVHSMLTGMKRAPAENAIINARPVAALMLLVWAVTLAWLLGR